MRGCRRIWLKEGGKCSVSLGCVTERVCAMILTGLLTHLDSFQVHFRLWPFLMCLLLSYDSSPLPCDCVCPSLFHSSLSEENLICLKPPDRVHMTRTSGSRAVRAVTVWFVKNRPAVLSHLSSALMRHHVADMSPINSTCVSLIRELIDQNE